MRGENSEERSPEEAFALVGHEIRVKILRALWEAPGQEVSFSTLRKHAGIRDSGQFNYHLGRLVGVFLNRTDSGYRFTYAGQRIVGAILDGTYTRQASVEPFRIDVPCLACGAAREARYENEAFYVACPACDAPISRFDLPPGALDGRTHEELVSMAATWVRARFLLIVDGICPNCAGTMTHGFTSPVDSDVHPVLVEHDCTRCMEHATSAVAWFLSYHPAVVSYCHDHGIDLRETWEPLQQLNERLTVTIRSESPWEVAVSVPEDDGFELILDENLQAIKE